MAHSAPNYLEQSVPQFIPVQPAMSAQIVTHQPVLVDPKFIELEPQEQVPAKQSKPPSLGKYCYWQKKGQGWSCEYKRRPNIYRYLGYIHSYDLAALRRRMNEQEIADYLRGIILDTADSATGTGEQVGAEQAGECDAPIIIRRS